MRKKIRFIALLLGCIGVMASCGKPSRAEQYRAEKYQRDSAALVAQQRTLDYYQSQLEQLLPKADSLLPLFTYEKNDKYQDHGYYVKKYNYGNVRVLVRDDGKQPILVYQEGKRVKNPDMNLYPEAQQLSIVIADIRELEKRIRHTSLEVEKYQKRIQKSTLSPTK